MKKIRGFDSPEEFLKTYKKIRKIVILANQVNKSSGVIKILTELSELADEVFDNLVRMDMVVEEILKEAGYFEANRNTEKSKRDKHLKRR